MDGYVVLLSVLVALLVGLAIGKAWERYKLRDGQWIDRRRARESPHYMLGLNFLVTNQTDPAIEELTTITGQRAQVRRARKSIASFKLREGMAVGARVTLRGARMYEFLDRLVSIALPRIRDFRGLDPGSFDGRGNYSLGIREQIIFPEIDYDSVPAIRGLDVAITTTASNDEQARALLGALGLPFAAERRRDS